MNRYLCYLYKPCYPERGRKIGVDNLGPDDSLSVSLDCLPATVVRWSFMQAASARIAREKFKATLRLEKGEVRP